MKAANPGALVVGPEEWGWPSFQYSPFDFQWLSQGRWGLTPPDQAALGYTKLLPWLLAQLKASDLANGQRTLDIFTGAFTIRRVVRPLTPMSLLQFKLYEIAPHANSRDPSYVSESWVNDCGGVNPADPWLG